MFTAGQIILDAALASRAENNDTIDIAVLGGLRTISVERLRNHPLSAVRSGAQTYRSRRHRHRREGFKVTKGAPQRFWRWRLTRKEVKSAVEKAVNEFAARGFRSLGVGRAEADQWQFLGVLPLFDPPREDAKATIATARKWA